MSDAKSETARMPFPPRRKHSTTADDHGAGLDPTHELDLRMLIVIARKRATMVAAIVVMSTLLATAHAFSQPPIYTAAATVHLSKEPPDPTSARYVIAYEGLAEEYLNTQIRIIRSRKVAAVVLDRDPEVAHELQSSGDPIAALQAGVTVKPIAQSYLVEIGYEHEERTLVARYANAVAEAYVAHVASDRETKTRAAERNLAEQLPILGQKLLESERALQRFLSDNEYLGFERQQDLAIERLRTLTEALLVTQKDRLQKDGEIEAINSLLKDGRLLVSAPPIAASSTVQALRAQLATVELEWAQLLERYGEEWPRVKQLKTRRDELKLQISSEIETIRSSLIGYREAKANEEASIGRLVDIAREDARKLEQQAQRYKNLRSEVEANRKFYDEFSQRLKEVSSYSQVDVSNVRVLDQAREPWAPVRPNRPREIALGFAFGLAVALALSVLLEFADERLRTPQDVTTHLRLTTLALVPSVEDLPEMEREKLAVAKPSSGFAEAFRRLRAQVEAKLPQQHQPGKGTVLLVTSAGVGEGKTITSINLAVAIANAGARVCLVDADMRNPRVHAVAGIARAPGLAEALDAGGTTLPELSEGIVSGLVVIPAGRSAKNPAELLATGEALGRLIERLRARYDRVVIDAPPAAALSDPSLIAPYADGVLFVVSSRTTLRRAALLGKSSLQGVGVHPIGVVLNNVSENELAGIYGYGYGPYSYAYHGEEQASREGAAAEPGPEAERQA